MGSLLRISISFLGAVLLNVATLHGAGAAEQIPLKGSITIVPGGTTVFDPPYIRQTRLITGIVSGMGVVGGEIVQNIDTRDLTFFGEFTLTSASGDSVTGTVTGQLLPTEDPTVFEVVEDITITGGTGRYEGATGSATGTGYAIQGTGEAFETFEGTISSPGSLR